MKLARLFAPLMVAVALVAPATAPAAHAEPSPVQMVITPGGRLAPVKNFVTKSQWQIVKNLDANLHSIEIKNRENPTITSGQQQIAAGASKAFQPWAGQTHNGPLTRLYNVYLDNSLAAVITVID
ncbi:MAG TPA: hypothetical protein VFQ85_05545 [Mycobacteriales bacterium]|jgi:hypothetical protein|nr:hypothetical protein [Mycobacteriales bacterium]